MASGYEVYKQAGGNWQLCHCWRVIYTVEGADDFTMIADTLLGIVHHDSVLGPGDWMYSPPGGTDLIVYHDHDDLVNVGIEKQRRLWPLIRAQCLAAGLAAAFDDYLERLCEYLDDDDQHEASAEFGQLLSGQPDTFLPGGTKTVPFSSDEIWQTVWQAAKHEDDHGNILGCRWDPYEETIIED